MSDDEPFIQVSNQSYCGRLGDSVKAMFFGPILIFVAIYLLIWNEGNAVAAHRSLDEGMKKVVELPLPDIIDTSYQGKLVHLVGRAETQATLRDNLFGVQPVDNVLKLQRSVEMYQWTETAETETHKNTGGSSTTTTKYTYDTKWSSTAIDSHSFYDSVNHLNPPMPCGGTKFVAEPITLGAFTLSSDLVGRMDWFSQYAFSSLSVDNITDDALRHRAQVSSNGFYIGTNPFAPQVGDMKISFSVVFPQTISIVAQQMGTSFSSYYTRNGRPILLLEAGTRSARELFLDAHGEATAMAFALRLVGFILMFAGFRVMAEPLATCADILPFFGNLVGGAASCILCPIAFSLSLIVITVSWIAYRPLISIPLLAAIVAATYYYIKSRNNSYAQIPEADIPEAEIYIDPQTIPVATAWIDPEATTNRYEHEMKK